MTQAAIRSQLRQKRLALSQVAQLSACQKISQTLCDLPAFMQSQRMAFYLANEGEIDPCLILDHAIKQAKQCYLPVLDPNNSGQLVFAKYSGKEGMVTNHFNIPEPALHADNQIAAQDLDIVFMPLVGFDEQCNRIGMGGGFYDKTLAFRRSQNKPLLIGLAHQCQKVANIASNSWDIPLDCVITDQAIYTHPSNNGAFDTL